MHLEPGETYAEYQVAGFIFRVGPPRLKFREEGDKTFMRVEMEMETYPPRASQVDQEGTP